MKISYLLSLLLSLSLLLLLLLLYLDHGPDYAIVEADVMAHERHRMHLSDHLLGIERLLDNLGHDVSGAIHIKHQYHATRYAFGPVS